MPRRGDAGYSLVELLVISIIIGIIASIAIVTFTRQRDKADRSSAVSTLRNVETFVESIRAETGDLATRAADFAAETAAYGFVDAPVGSTGPGVVSIWGDGVSRQLTAAVVGGAYCYYVRVDDINGTFRHREPAGAVTCTGSEFQAGAGSGWG